MAMAMGYCSAYYFTYEFEMELDLHPKAALLAAAAWQVGIPSAVGLSNVVKSLSIRKLKTRMEECNVFVQHGWTALYLKGRYLKAVRAFNMRLCAQMGAAPMNLDGSRTCCCGSTLQARGR